MEFASQNGFDPLVALNWKKIQRREIVKVKRKKDSRKERREIEFKNLKRQGVVH